MENTSGHQERSNGWSKMHQVQPGWTSAAGWTCQLWKTGFWTLVLLKCMPLYCRFKCKNTHSEIQLHGSIPALCCQHRVQASSQSGACWSLRKYWMYAAGWFNSASLRPLSMRPMTVILLIYNYLLNCEKFCEFCFSGLKLKCIVLEHRLIVLSFLEDLNCQNQCQCLL